MYCQAFMQLVNLWINCIISVCTCSLTFVNKQIHFYFGHVTTFCMRQWKCIFWLVKTVITLQTVPDIDSSWRTRNKPGGRQQSGHLRRVLEPLARRAEHIQGLPVRTEETLLRLQVSCHGKPKNTLYFKMS